MSASARPDDERGGQDVRSEYDATLRLRADTLRQQSENKFHAKNAFVTTSEFGQPGYSLNAGEIFVDNEPNPFTGKRLIPLRLRRQSAGLHRECPRPGSPRSAVRQDEA